jgi:hypothetical protein
MEDKQIVEIILILVAAGVIAFVIFNGMLKTDSDKEMCRASVVAKWMAKRVGSEDIFQLNCKSHITKITEATLLGARKPEDEIKKIIATEMYDCWYMFNRGQFDFENMFKTALTGPKQICVVCADISFDSKVSDKYKTVTGFNTWTIDNNVPGKDYSYYDYLTNNGGEDIKNDVKATALPADSIDTTKEYQVVFAVVEGSAAQNFVQAGTTIAVGMVGARLLGAKIGAAAGTALGGPIGTVVGLGAGWFISWGIGYLASLKAANQYMPMTLVVPTESTPQYCKVFY